MRSNRGNSRGSAKTGFARSLARIGCISILLVGCSEPETAVPAALVGHWQSEDARYHDRILEIRDDAIVFGTGEFEIASHHGIVRVEAASTNEPRTWRIEFRERDGSRSSVELVHRTTPKPGLRFAGRDDWWHPWQEEADDDWN